MPDRPGAAGHEQRRALDRPGVEHAAAVDPIQYYGTGVITPPGTRPGQGKFLDGRDPPRVEIALDGTCQVETF